MKLSELFEGDGIGKPAKNLWSHEVFKDSRVHPLDLGCLCPSASIAFQTLRASIYSAAFAPTRLECRFVTLARLALVG
ncbi:hypothetical protein ANRL1_04870 [Anaerolineae bacterium]|nr:hypothetical protein ANRL1_04870 [Anaerolineae bacterium]